MDKIANFEIKPQS